MTDEHLGAGAYASVRTGISRASGEEFAIKLVDKHEPGHTRSRILREVETFNLCRGHPNIVQLEEVVNCSGSMNELFLERLLEFDLLTITVNYFPLMKWFSSGLKTMTISILCSKKCAVDHYSIIFSRKVFLLSKRLAK